MAGAKAGAIAPSGSKSGAGFTLCAVLGVTSTPQSKGKNMLMMMIERGAIYWLCPECDQAFFEVPETGHDCEV